MMTKTSFTALSDRELIAETNRLAQAERLATAGLIRSLLEFDARKLYRGEGCGSLFTYCTEILHLSADAAYNRMEVMSAARRFPAILDALEEGALTLTTARRLGPHLTEANCHGVLAAARFKGKREIEELIATLNPKPDVETLGVPMQPNLLTPLARERFMIQFTIGRETHDKLREVQDLLRHSILDGNLAGIFDRALDLLLKSARRRRYAETDRPRASGQPVAGSRTIPAAVRRAVAKRDGRRCTFIGPNGRCTETSLLQFHHDDPFAMGGTATINNIRLLCAVHNRYEAELFYGVNYPGIVREDRPTWPESRSGTAKRVSYLRSLHRGCDDAAAAKLLTAALAARGVNQFQRADAHGAECRDRACGKSSNGRAMPPATPGQETRVVQTNPPPDTRWHARRLSLRNGRSAASGSSGPVADGRPSSA
jgi:hypothetical protein